MNAKSERLFGGRTAGAQRRKVSGRLRKIAAATVVVGGSLAVVSLGQAEANARATCGGNVATIVGTSGNDNIRGTSGNDVIYAGNGHDVVNGLGGHDVICGGAGNDTIYGSGGHDRLIGGAGADRLEGGAGVDELLGSNGNDLLLGGDGPDLLIGNADNDVLRGGGLNDQLYGGPGNDSLYGGGGHDHLWGSDGNDMLDGGGTYNYCDGERKTSCVRRQVTTSDLLRGQPLLLASDRQSWAQFAHAKRALTNALVTYPAGFRVDGDNGNGVSLAPGTVSQISPGGNVSVDGDEVSHVTHHDDGSATYVMDDGTTVHQPADPNQPATVTTPPAEPEEEPQMLDPIGPSQCQSCHGAGSSEQEGHADGEGIDNSDGGGAGEGGCGECGGEGLGDGGQNVGDGEAIGDD